MFPLILWKDGQFYQLQDAYSLSFLTWDDLRNLRAYFQKGQWDGLSAEIELQMLQAYFDNFDLYKPKGREPADRQPVNMEEVFVDSYLGSYNDCFIVRFADLYLSHWDYSYDIIVADITYSSSYILPLAWKSGQLYSLQEAYNLGFLTVDDLIQLKDTIEKWKY
ncbi:MAG: hypothetical protein FWH41_08380 [Treponema sp.]|nr:hypothetical protein [Treponema sp.]